MTPFAVFSFLKFVEFAEKYRIIGKHFALRSQKIFEFSIYLKGCRRPIYRAIQKSRATPLTLRGLAYFQSGSLKILGVSKVVFFDL